MFMSLFDEANWESEIVIFKLGEVIIVRWIKNVWQLLNEISLFIPN